MRIARSDLKTSNILFDNHGVLKVCDYGMARHYGSPLQRYTQLVVTLWYRYARARVRSCTRTRADWRVFTQRARAACWRAPCGVLDGA